MFLPIAEFRPDSASLNTPYSDEIRNVLPADGAYVPMPAFHIFSQPLPEKPLGAIAVRGLDGTVAIFAGTTTKLYRLNNTDLSWVDVSRTGAAYAASAQAKWSFAHFGSYIIAVNNNDAPQVFQLGQSSRFRALGGNPPRAGMVKIWGDFVALMQLTDAPNRVHWSGLNDAEWWTPGSRNCDFQDFADGGVVQGSSETTNPVILLQSAIYLGSFVPGSDIVFSFQKIHDRRGAKSSSSIAARGENIFYADEGGFFQTTLDGTLLPIGFEKVDRSVFSQNASRSIANITATIDPFYSRIYWMIDDDEEGVFRQMLVYDWGLQRWSMVDAELVALLPIYNAGRTLDGLDAVSNSLDALPFSLDSKVWQGGAPVLGAFSSDYRLGAFSGKAMEAVVTTAEMGATNGDIQQLHSLVAVVDSNQGLVSLSHRLRQDAGEPLIWGQERRPSYNSGRYHIRSRSRFHKIRLRMPAGETWHHIKGFDVDWQKSGTR